MDRRRVMLALGIIVAVAALVRFLGIGNGSLWMDEEYSLRTASQPFWQVLTDHDQTPPLWNLILHFWIQVAGTSEAALRIPSAFFGTAAVAAVFFAGRKLVGDAAALAASGILALSLQFIVHSQEARTYELFLLATILSYNYFLRLLAEGPARRRRTAAGYVVCTALMLYSHVFGVFFLAAQNVHVLLTRQPARWASGRWLGLQGAVVLLFAPWLPTFLERTTSVAGGFWIPPVTLQTLAGTGYNFSGTIALTGAFALLFFAWLAASRLWHPPAAGGAPNGDVETASATWRRNALLLGWLVLPIAVPFVISLRWPIYYPKYSLPAAIPLYLMIGQWTTRLQPPRWRAAPLIVIGILMVAGVASFDSGHDAADYKQDWRGAVHYLDEHAAPGALVLFNTGVCDSTTDTDRQCVYDYYGKRTDLRLVPFFPVDWVTPDNIGKLDPLVQNETRVWLVTPFLTDFDHLIPARLAGNFTRTDDQPFLRISVQEWVRTPAAGPPST
jgi:mannosyltransferase